MLPERGAASLVLAGASPVLSIRGEIRLGRILLSIGSSRRDGSLP